MKNRFFVIFLILVLISTLLLPLYEKAYADVLTVGSIGAASYALMTDWGINFTAANATSTGMQDWMEGQVNDYQRNSGSSLIELFGSESLRIVAGKLVIAHTLYNGIIDFKDWLVDKFNLTDTSTLLQSGTLGGQPLGTREHPIPANMDGNTALRVVVGEVALTGIYVPYTFYYNDTIIISDSLNDSNWYLEPLNYANCYFYKEGQIIKYQLVASRGGIEKSKRNTLSVSGIAQTEDSLNANFSQYYVEPTVLYPDKEWSGTIGGQDWPDTNLDQLIGSIYDDVADNNLDVDGEVIDVPVPPPTPAPIDPDIPLSDVPWEGLDTNLQNLYNQGLEEIGAIGDAQDAITDAIGVQTGVLDDAIADNAGVVSGAIDQAVSDIQDAIGDQTAALDQSMSATAEATESIADALEDETINWQKFNLRGLFPFCIPFDIYNMLEALDASPTAPHVELPFVIESIGFSYTIDLDFSDFDTVAAVMRQMELIVYGIALAWATSKVIKW